MTEPTPCTSSQAAAHLHISPSTLRRWTVEFADFLSAAAAAPDIQSRLYAAQDLELLSDVKAFLAEGLTYYQVGKTLEARHSESEPEGGRTLAVSEGGAAAAAFLSDTLQTVSDGQQLLLGSQQATRDLLGVLLQDNFTLKEENAKLRDRMLNLERELTEFRRHSARHRKQVDTRLESLETDGAVPPGASSQPSAGGRSRAGRDPDLPAEPKGCLAALLGVTD
jgi:DNA-binding transcriptional MerR regulator